MKIINFNNKFTSLLLICAQEEKYSRDFEIDSN